MSDMTVNPNAKMTQMDGVSACNSTPVAPAQGGVTTDSLHRAPLVAVHVITIPSAPQLDPPDPSLTATPTGLQQVQAQLERAFPIVKVIGNFTQTLEQYMKSHPGGLQMLGPSVLVALAMAQALLTKLAKEQKAVFGEQFIKDLSVTIEAMNEKIKADIEGGQLQAEQFRQMGIAGLTAAIGSLAASAYGWKASGSKEGLATGKFMEGVSGASGSLGQAATNFIQANFANPIAATKAKADGYANMQQLAQQMMQKDMQNYDAVGNTLDTAMKGLSDAISQFFQAMQMRL